MKAPTMLKRQLFWQVEGPAIFWRFNGWVLLIHAVHDVFLQFKGYENHRNRN